MARLCRPKVASFLPSHICRWYLAYERAWEFAAEHDLPILAHTWSVSDYNPAQRYSTPERLETYVRRFPRVRLLLATRAVADRDAARRSA